MRPTHSWPTWSKSPSAPACAEAKPSASTGRTSTCPKACPSSAAPSRRSTTTTSSSPHRKPAAVRTGSPSHPEWPQPYDDAGAADADPRQPSPRGDLVVYRPDGRPLHPEYVLNRFHLICRKAGVPRTTCTAHATTLRPQPPETPKRPPLHLCGNGLRPAKTLVGTTGFEPATPCPPPVLRRFDDGSFLSRIGTAEVRVIECEITIATTAGRTTGVYRLATTLLDHRRYPAFELVRLYHERWEVESAYSPSSSPCSAAVCCGPVPSRASHRRSTPC